MFTTPEVIINGKRHICLSTLATQLQYNPTYTRFLASQGIIPGTKRRGRWYFHLPAVLQALGWQESKSNEPTTRINKAIISKDLLAAYNTAADIALYVSDQALYALFPAEIIYDKRGRPQKKPKNTGWQHTSHNPYISAEDLGEVYGVSLKDDDVVIDIDKRHFRSGHHESKELWERLNLPMPGFIVETGNGWHFYYKKPHDLRLKNYIPDTGATPATCITVKRPGEYVVAAGSRHPSGKIYKMVQGSPETVTMLPDELSEIIKEDLFNYSDYLGKEVFDDAPATIERSIQFLISTSLISVEYEQGDRTACRVADQLKRFGLFKETAFMLMWKYWNNRCKPPWDHQELAIKVDNGYKYWKSVQGEDNPSADFDDYIEDLYPVENQFDAEQMLFTTWDFYKRKVSSNAGSTEENTDRLKSTLANAVNFFVLPILDSIKSKVEFRQGHELYRLLRLNQFSLQIEFVKPAPWHNPQFPKYYWEDSDLDCLMHMMGRLPQFNVGSEVWQRAVNVVAMAYAYHPVRNYLNALKWDGNPRLDTWLIDYAGADDDQYCQEVGKNTLIALVARVFQPGAQHDHMLVLEGKQGTGKSSLVRILGGPFYADIQIDPHNKDTVGNMQRAWILEASELEFFRRSDVQAIKSFITKTVDIVRLPYARNAVTLPRQCGFIGTINPDSTGCYFQDTTGNRRFWPVKTRTIDLAALSENRDQLFAEAVIRYKQGEKWHITDPGIQKLAISNQHQRLHGDLWTEAIAQWLSKPTDAEFPNLPLTTNSIAFQALAIPVKEYNKSIAIRIAKIMKDLKYEHKHIWDKSTKSRIWIWELDCLGDL